MALTPGIHTPGPRTRQLHPAAPDVPHHSRLPTVAPRQSGRISSSPYLQQPHPDTGPARELEGLQPGFHRHAGAGVPGFRHTGNRAREGQLPGKRKPGRHPAPARPQPHSPNPIQRRGIRTRPPRPGGMMPIQCNAGPSCHTGGRKRAVSTRTPAPFREPERQI